MNITRVGTQPSTKGPAEWFTGTVRIDPLFQPHAPARAVGASVTFEPGARTAGHTHPLGQTLLITAGCGWVQREGGSVEEVHPGDVVWFSAGERHWPGATATSAMTHKPPKKGKLIKDKRCWIAEGGGLGVQICQEIMIRTGIFSHPWGNPAKYGRLLAANAILRKTKRQVTFICGVFQESLLSNAKLIWIAE